MSLRLRLFASANAEKRRPTTPPRRLRRAKLLAEDHKRIRARRKIRKQASTRASDLQGNSREASRRLRIGQRRLARPWHMVSQLLIFRT
jgi:hypothetical protein